MKKRALIAIRLSVKKDESTSPERQDEAIRLRIDQIGASVAGTADDLNVSASKVDPFRRPKLGEWLNHRTDEFDTIVWWRMDRAVRSMTDLHKLVAWAREHEKQLMFCDGPGADYSFDFTKAGDEKARNMALMLATIISWAASLESEAISDRVKSSHEYLRKHGEWGGGVVPYGFEPRRAGERGWKLFRDPITFVILREIIERVMDGDTMQAVCADLNDQGTPSPRDHWRQSRGGDSLGRTWNTQGVSAILKSRTLLGELHHDGKLVLDHDGEPVVRNEAAVTEAEWVLLQSAMAERRVSKTHYNTDNPLLGIAHCARCGMRYYMRQELQKGKTYINLQCASRQGNGRKSCGQPTLSMVYALKVVEQTTMWLIGDQEVTKRRYVPGDDRSEELAFTQRRIEYLAEEWDEGLIKDRAEYIRRLKALRAKEAAVGSEPIRQAGYEWVGTGRNYIDVWPETSPEAKRKLLLDLGVKIFIGRGDSAAADEAWRNQGDDRQEQFRAGRVFDEGTINGMLIDTTDGRVKKNFQVWWLQESLSPLHELDRSKE